MRKTILRAVVTNVSLALLLAGTVLLAYSGDAEPKAPTKQQAQIEDMILWYGCWTDEMPARAKPTHAVVTYRDGEPNLVSVVLARDIMRHPDENPGMTVHTLCP